MVYICPANRSAVVQQKQTQGLLHRILNSERSEDIEVKVVNCVRRKRLQIQDIPQPFVDHMDTQARNELLLLETTVRDTRAHRLYWGIRRQLYSRDEKHQAETLGLMAKAAAEFDYLQRGIGPIDVALLYQGVHLEVFSEWDVAGHVADFHTKNLVTLTELFEAYMQLEE
jgi:hypothetical protein